MKDFVKKYLPGLGLIIVLILIAVGLGKITNFNIGNQSASVLVLYVADLASTTGAMPASGYAWNDTVGWINFGDEDSDPDGRVYVSDDKLYGYAWGENVGWISLSCENDDTCGSSDYRVVQATSGGGVLTGYAWGENIGWINFAPTGSGVTIDRTSGAFSGYAWGENIGWILFPGADYGVTTTWNNPPGGGPTTCTNFTYRFSACVNSIETVEEVLTREPAGCNGGSPITERACTLPITLSIDPVTLKISTNNSTTFTATITGTTTTGVIWSIEEGLTGGSITSDGVYTAPSAVGTYHIIATAVADNTITATSIVTVKEGIVVSLPLATTTIYNTEQIQFTPVISGTDDKRVIWTIFPVEDLVPNFYGTISDTGLYTAPDRTVNVTIFAKSLADTSIIAKTNVAVRLKPLDLSIIPINSRIAVNDKIQFTATITGGTKEVRDRGVEWIVMEEISPLQKGGIDKNGLFTAPTVGGIFTVKAVVRGHTDVFALAKVDVRLSVEPEATSTVINTLENIRESILDRIFNNTKDDNPNTNSNGGGGSNSLLEDISSTLDISDIILDNVAILGTTTEKIILGAQKVLESRTGSTVSKTITTAGVVGGGVAATGVFALNGTVVADLAFLPFKLWGLLLSVLGLKKRNRPWGTVYDSVTKQPIDPAYVTLKKLHSKEETTSITDLDGRYGFLVSPGQYLLTANKTNYIFPSKKLAGKIEDELYNNLYFGEKIIIENTGALISKNIPLDPVKFDWNEFAKGKKKMMKFYSKREKLVRIVTDWIFRIGFVISLLSLFLVSAPYNLIIFGLYLVLTALRKFGLKQKALGVLSDKDGYPLSYAIVRVIDSELKVEITNKVADKIGRYYCLVPKGKYFVKVEKKNDDETYSLIYTSPVLNAENGIINRDFII